MLPACVAEASPAYASGHWLVVGTYINTEDTLAGGDRPSRTHVDTWEFFMK
jgi:hypothetical protein